MCSDYGYKFEEHFVTTEDGYVLSLYRIPGKLSEESTETTSSESPSTEASGAEGEGTTTAGK